MRERSERIIKTSGTAQQPAEMTSQPVTNLEESP